jgi:hypothetical protein
MFKKIRSYFKAWINGDEVTIDGSVEFTWWEVGAIVVIIGLLIRWIWW